MFIAVKLDDNFVFFLICCLFKSQLNKNLFKLLTITLLDKDIQNTNIVVYKITSS